MQNQTFKDNDKIEFYTNLGEYNDYLQLFNRHIPLQTKWITFSELKSMLVDGKFDILHLISNKELLKNMQFLKFCISSNARCYNHLPKEAKQNIIVATYTLHCNYEMYSDVIDSIKKEDISEIVNYYFTMYLTPSTKIAFYNSEEKSKLGLDKMGYNVADNAIRRNYVYIPQILAEIRHGLFDNLKTLNQKFGQKYNLAFAKQCMEQNANSFMYFSKEVQLHEDIKHYLNTLPSISTQLLVYLQKHYKKEFENILITNHCANHCKSYPTLNSTYLTPKAQKQYTNIVRQTKAHHFGEGEDTLYRDLLEEFDKEYTQAKKQAGRMDLI